MTTQFSTPSTLGMKFVAVISMLWGGMTAIGNTIEVIQGQTFAGMTVRPVAAVLGLSGALISALLAVGGIGAWAGKSYGRTCSLSAAVATILINGLATAVFDFPFAFFLIGAIYPVVLLIVFNLPTWKHFFSQK